MQKWPLWILLFWMASACGGGENENVPPAGNAANSPGEATQAPAVAPEAMTPIEAVGGWKKLESGKVQIQHPDAWEVRPVETPVLFRLRNLDLGCVVSASGTQDGPNQPVFQSLKIWSDINLEQAKMQMTEFKIESQETLKVNGRTCVQNIITGKLDGDLVKTCNRLFIANGRGYVLNFTALNTEDFDRGWSEGEKILATFGIE